MSFIPKAHEIYKHFKGNLYQIVAIAEHSETGEQLVIYQALYGEFKIYARPLSMFTGKVDKEKYPHVIQEFRFELQGPDSGRQTGSDKTTESDKANDSSVAAMKSVDESNCSPCQQPEHKEQPESIKEQDESCEEQEELQLDPMVLEFLDADCYEQRLNILAGVHHRITDEMITTMAIACDIEVAEGDTEERYESLRSCLLTLERYECNRLR